MPDKYDVQARYVPALVCSVPLLFLWFYYLKGLDGSFWQSVSVVAIGSLGLSTALFIVVVHFGRAIGKLMEEKMFKRGLTFPTTEFLLDTDNNLSPDMKAKIISKIHARFGIQLSARTKDTGINRRAIHEAIGQVRSMFYKKNPMVLQRNIQFGLSKNLFGGCVLATGASILGLILSLPSHDTTTLQIAASLIAIYSVVGIGSFVLIPFTARHYATTIYDEFMAS